jgi:small subunit ribosomal protein S19
MPKEFTYRGKSIDELKAMDTREFAKYLKSKARRAVLRQFDVIEKFVARSKKEQEKGKPIRTHLRDIVVVPKMIDMVIYIYNGKEFMQTKVIEEMLGHRLGEFAPTRRKVQHGAPGIGATKSSGALSVK